MISAFCLWATDDDTDPLPASVLVAMGGEGVRLVGHVDDVVPYLQCMDAFVLPTWREGLGLASGAAACGIPVVTTCSRSRRHRCRPRNWPLGPAEIRRTFACNEILITDRQRATSMGVAGRRFVEQSFSPWERMENWETCCKRMNKVLDKCCRDCCWRPGAPSGRHRHRVGTVGALIILLIGYYSIFLWARGAKESLQPAVQFAALYGLVLLACGIAIWKYSPPIDALAYVSSADRIAAGGLSSTDHASPAVMVDGKSGYVLFLATVTFLLGVGRTLQSR